MKNQNQKIEDWEKRLKEITGMLVFSELLKENTGKEIRELLENLNYSLSNFIRQLLESGKEKWLKELEEEKKERVKTGETYGYAIWRSKGKTHIT